MSFARRSSYAYRETLGGPAPAPQHDDLPRPSIFNPTARLKAAQETARTPAGKPTTVAVPLAGGGKTTVQAKGNDPQAIEKAFNAKRRTDPTLRDRSAIIENKGPNAKNAKFEGAGNVITGVAPKEIARPEGVTLASITGHMQVSNKDLSRTTFRDASVSVAAGNTNLTASMVGTTTLSSLSGNNVKVGNQMAPHLALVNATNAKVDHPTPHMTSIRPGESRRRQLELMGLAA